MQTEMAMTLAKVAYAKILRDLIIKKIDDPDSNIDESIIEIFDLVFEYKNVKVAE